MSDVLHSGEADRRPNLAPEHSRALEREGCDPPERRDFQASIYSKPNLAFRRARGLGQRSIRLRNREDPAEATP